MASRHTPLRVAFRRPWPTTRRGLKLWLLAVVIGLLGLNYIISPIPPTTRKALALPDAAMPLEWWGVAIVALSLSAAFTAYCHRGRDWYGYMALVAFSFGWAMAYALSPILYDGSTRAFSGALTWALIGVFLLSCAQDEK